MRPASRISSCGAPAAAAQRLLLLLAALAALSCSSCAAAQPHSRRLMQQRLPRDFVPPSPFGKPSNICPAKNGSIVQVQGYPSSPWVWRPFQRPFGVPPLAQKLDSVLRADGHQMDIYELTAVATSLNIGCRTNTTFLAYNGFVPGPTFRVRKGNEVVVRISNKIAVPSAGLPNMTIFEPCSETGRSGHPITTHHHGSASLAPYDGWAEDETCFNETKDYIYPANRDATEWYHDHALDITSNNVYWGMAGLFTTIETCGQPWNLDNIPDVEMVLQDKVLNDKCELYYDFPGPHRNNLYGDVNLVNGIPWPIYPILPKTYRFRWVGGGPSRAWRLSIVSYNAATSTFTGVSSRICKIIAGDGGWRARDGNSNFDFPEEGLHLGVAERYEVVCDFTDFSNQTLYLFNGQTDDLQKTIPYFCYTHLLMKFEVAPCPADFPKRLGVACTSPHSTLLHLDAPNPIPSIEDVIDQNIYDQALALLAKGEWDRKFEFGRNGGQWAINNQNWFTARVAANDVGQNSWEIWRLQGGGGWFHPIHIHLIDFYVLQRDGDPAKVKQWEYKTPKDVVQLYLGGNVDLLAVFGPHQGEYMFHCHSLVHEDHVMMRSFNVTPVDVSKRPERVGPLIDAQVIEKANIIYDTFGDPMSVRPLRLDVAEPLTNRTYLQSLVDERIYRLFYPQVKEGVVLDDPRLADASLNPWRLNVSTVCQTPDPLTRSPPIFIT